MSLIAKTIKKAQGFTLIEVITILFIVSLALVGILSLVVQSLNSQSYNKNNLIAYQLAQEGIELIRHVRDSNWRANQAWNNNLGAGEAVYYMDYLDTAPHPLTSPGQNILRLDSAGFYSHDPSGTPSGFSRTMKVDSINAGHALILVVEIAWLDHDRNYFYDLDTYLYDWR